jgi:hypothetical protein
MKHTNKKYARAFEDLRLNPGKYTQSEWVELHHIGHQVATNAGVLGFTVREGGRIHLKKMPTNAEINGIRKMACDARKEYIRKREAQTVTYVYAKKGPVRVDPQGWQAPPDIATVRTEAPTPTAPVPALTQPTRVGLIRRFLRWIW